MPISFPPISRRRFLSGTVAAGAGLLLGPEWLAAADQKTDPHRLALLSDTHIAVDPAMRYSGVVMYQNMRQVCDEVIQLNPRPAAVLINGDCAFREGLSSDYERFVELLRPLREHGLPVHLAMGNHDRRDNLWKTVPDSEEHVSQLPHRQIAILQMERANIFILDSLEKTAATPGSLGEKQVTWLAAALDQHAAKPAVVFVHHQPDENPDVKGLKDTRALLDVLLPRKQVKALIYGHTHHWEVKRREGMHCINLPATAYVFVQGDPIGWVDAHIKENGISLKLLCIDKKHAKYEETVDLIWRG